MHGIDFIQDMALVMVGAGAGGWICRRLGLSLVVGYLLAGIIVVPGAAFFSFKIDTARIQAISQTGLIFLMFSIGMGLSFQKLRRLGAAPFVAAGLGAFILFNICRLLGKAAGLETVPTLFIASMLVVSSSAVIAKVLQDFQVAHHRAGQLALGFAIMEDVIAIVMLAVLSAYTHLGALQPGISVWAVLSGLLVFIVFFAMVGLALVPHALRKLDSETNAELLIIVVAGLLFLTSFFAVKAGYSLAIGAFLMGAIVAETPQKKRIEAAFEGIRDVFSGVFFVSIGMMIEIRVFLESWTWIVGLSAFTLLARSSVCSFGLMVAGTRFQNALRAGLILTPLGEFSFIIAQVGVIAGIIPASFYSCAVGVSILTALVSPLLVRHAEPISNGVTRILHPEFMEKLAIYHDWIEQIQQRRFFGLWWQLSRKRLLQVSLEMLFVTGTLFFSEPLHGLLAHKIPVGILHPTAFESLFCMAVALLILPAVVAVWRNLDAMSMLYAEMAVGDGKYLGRLKPFIEYIFKSLCGAALVWWIASLLPFHELPFWLWFGVALGVCLVLFFFYRKIVYWHSWWEISMRETLSSSPSAAKPPSWAQRHKEWSLATSDCVLPIGAACAGKTIKELAVRSRFGCTVAEINRHGTRIPNPKPDQAIYAEDCLLLAGDYAQMDAARSFLCQTSQVCSQEPEFDEVGLEMIKLVAGSHLLGGTLGSVAIPQATGVQVMGIQRQEQRILNPIGSEKLLENDMLLVLGSPDQIRFFRAWSGAAVRDTE